MKETKKRRTILYMVQLALLTAIVLVLQLAGIAIKLPFLATPVSLVLIPIVLGAIVLGPLAGAWLGLVFGLEVFIVCGVMGGDPTFTAILFQNSPFLTFLTCVVKSTVAGYVAGLCYRLLKKKNRTLAMVLAAVIAPILNTGIFILGCLLMANVFRANFLADGVTLMYFLVIGCAGVNFLVEFAINVAFAPALGRIAAAIQKKPD